MGRGVGDLDQKTILHEGIINIFISKISVIKKFKQLNYAHLHITIRATCTDSSRKENLTAEKYH